MRDKATVITELRDVMKQIMDKVDDMPDCGGLQGAAVLHSCPHLKARLMSLAQEAENLGITPELLQIKAP